jgi:hypothetical protein
VKPGLAFPTGIEAIRIRRERVGEHFQGIVPLERGVMRSPDLAHAAFANQGGQFIRAEARTRNQRHS